jgi:hypothetical protein
MLKVYFETTNGYSELKAIFDNEETYIICFPALEKLARKNGYFITESVEETHITNLN